MSESVYHRTSASRRGELLHFGSGALQQYQLRRLRGLLDSILPDNEFYSQKFAGYDQKLESLKQLSELPLTTKQELVESRGDNRKAGFAANLTYPPDRYSRFHRTSGTSGRPMIVLDTNDDWNWWMEAWQYVLDSAGLQPDDRVLMAFSFGPFIGFWSAFDAAVERGCMVLPTGAMSSLARLELTQSVGATVLFCTPSYALHLAEVAAEHRIDLKSNQVTRIVVAGEPGGSIPEIRSRIEDAWQAQVLDHSGASEVGPWGFADRQRKGVHVNEAEFIAEFLPLEQNLGTKHPTSTLRPSPPPGTAPETYELVLTCLGRFGSPVIRYRTGDLVRPCWPEQEGQAKFVLLDGGVLGRADDMMIIRGVNVFPTSVEQILRGFPEIDEYRMTAYRQGEMDQLKIEVEDRDHDPQRIEQHLQVQLGFRVEVEDVPAQSLPRFEAKGKRFIDQR